MCFVCLFFVLFCFVLFIFFVFRYLEKFTIQLGGGHWGGGGGGGLNTATPQKILPNTASPQEKSLDHRHRNIYFQSDDFSVSTR